MVIQPHFRLNLSPYSVLIAHRDTGGTISLAIMRCRKITIAAINGHAVNNIVIFIDKPLIG